MEKLITKRNLSLFGIVSFLLVIALYFILQNNSKDDEKLFDIFLAELYNEQNSNLVSQNKSSLPKDNINQDISDLDDEIPF